MTQPSSQHIRFQGRSFPVLALEPQAPIAGWLKQLDEDLNRFPVSFARKSIVIDVSKLDLELIRRGRAGRELIQAEHPHFGTVRRRALVGVRRPAPNRDLRPRIGDR